VPNFRLSLNWKQYNGVKDTQKKPDPTRQNLASEEGDEKLYRTKIANEPKNPNFRRILIYFLIEKTLPKPLIKIGFGNYKTLYNQFIKKYS